MTQAKIRTSKLRSMRHMTQATLAERAHLSKTTISNLESGNQTKIALDTIAKLCKALDCTPSDLFELQDMKQENLLKRQREALTTFIGSIDYSDRFDPSKLDSDLAKISNIKKAKHKR